MGSGAEPYIPGVPSMPTSSVSGGRKLLGALLFVGSLLAILSTFDTSWSWLFLVPMAMLFFSRERRLLALICIGAFGALASVWAISPDQYYQNFDPEALRPIEVPILIRAVPLLATTLSLLLFLAGDIVLKGALWKWGWGLWIHFDRWVGTDEWPGRANQYDL